MGIVPLFCGNPPGRQAASTRLKDRCTTFRQPEPAGDSGITAPWCGDANAPVARADEKPVATGPRQHQDGMRDEARAYAPASGYIVPAAIVASFAMVFMLRAVPDLAAGIFRRESAMPSP